MPTGTNGRDSINNTAGKTLLDLSNGQIDRSQAGNWGHHESLTAIIQSQKQGNTLDRAFFSGEQYKKLLT